jgi:hypothetical protein
MGDALSKLGSWGIILGLVLTSSVISAVLTKLMDRTGVHLDRVREGYAEASKALVAWYEFPDRIERRVDDDPATRAALSQMGSDIKERLAYYSAWVSTESRHMGDVYMSLVAQLRADVAPWAQAAWKGQPRQSGPAMNLGHAVEPAPEGWRYVQDFALGFQYRFGWRRYAVPPVLLRRRLQAKNLLP